MSEVFHIFQENFVIYWFAGLFGFAGIQLYNTVRARKQLLKRNCRIRLAASIIVMVMSGVIVVATTYMRSTDPSHHPSSPSTTTQDQVSEYKQIKRTHYSLQVKSTYTNLPDDEKNPDADIAMGSESDRTFVQTFQESRGDFDTSLSIDRYADLIFETFEKKADGVTNASRTKLSSGDIANPHRYTVLDSRFTATIDDSINIVYYVRCVKTDDYFYTLYTWTVPSYEKTKKRTLLDIIESFSATGSSREA